MTFLASRRILTRFGPLDVDVVRGEHGSWRATLVGEHPRLSAVAGAVGSTEDEAVARLAAAVERFGSDEANPPRRPARE